MFLAEPVQDGEHILLDVAGHVVVRPQVVEPLPEFGVGGLVRGRQIDFQVGPGAAAQSAAGEVGAADDGGPTAFGLGKVHLAVQKVGLPDRADTDVMARYPLGARLGKVFLLEDAIGAETVFGHGEGLRFLFPGVQFANGSRVSEEEADVVNLVQGILQGFVAIYAEVGGHNAENLGGGEVLLEVIDKPAGAVVEDVLICCHLGFCSSSRPVWYVRL